MMLYIIYLCGAVILLALSIFRFVKPQTIAIKIIIFMIALCNISIVILVIKNNDGFTDYNSLLNTIKTFQDEVSNINTSPDTELNNDNKNQIMIKIEDLKTNLDSVANQLNTAIGQQQNQTIKNLQNINFNNSDNILHGVELYKQMQLTKLNDLQNQLIKTQQLVNAQQNIDDTNKYKPIKIYSSCIVNDADGSYST